MERSGSIQLDIPDFPSSVLSHLNQLRLQGRLCDIIVNVQGQSFRAHKVVLAASSPYFRDHMSLSQLSTVSLTVIRNPCVFEHLLTFCYTGRLSVKMCDIISYLTAASFLQMQHIIDRCTHILENIHLKIPAYLEHLEGEEPTRTMEALVRTSVHPSSGRLSRVEAECEPVSPAEEALSRPPTPPSRPRTPPSTQHGRQEPILRINRAGQWINPLSCRNSFSRGSCKESSSSSSSSCRRGSESPPHTPLQTQDPPLSTQHGRQEPILRINRAGQWYVETSSDHERAASPEEQLLDRVRIKTERLEMEEWMGADGGGAQGGAQGGSGGAGAGATVMIDTSGRSTLVTGPLGNNNVGGANSDNNAQPSSSFSEADRFSPTGSVVLLTERQRAKSESPSRADDRQPRSQGEENASFDMGGYEDYLREQVGDRWFRYNPRLTCIYCCKSFNQKGSLDRHMRLHMGITPFVCRICGKKYTRKDQLEYHIRKHTGNKPFHCHVCGKSFPFQAILNQHFRKNHPGLAPQQEAHSVSPETTVTSRGGGPSDEASPSQEDPELGSSEAPQASVSTTGPD